MKLEKLSSSPKFSILKEDSFTPSKSRIIGTRVMLSSDGTPIVRHSVIHTPTGMCVAGNLHLEADGSLIDVTVELKSSPTIEEVNNLFMNSQNETLKFTKEPIVSSDIIGKRCGSLIDGLLTNMVEVNGTRLYKIVSWYDNELGYTCQMLRCAKAMFKMNNNL